MAEQVVNFVASVATSELTSRVFSGLIQRYGKDAATREKLQRLEMLLIMIHSVIEASEKRTIKNSRLLQWRDKLKEAASQGDKVLDSFLQRAKDAQATSNTNNSNQQKGEAVSSSSSASAPTTDVSALPFTRNSLSDMVQGICNVRNMLFSTVDDDMERLNRTLESLENFSLEIGGFISLLRLEPLRKVDQKPYSTVPSTKAHAPTEKTGETRDREKMKHLATHSNPTLEPPAKEGKTKLRPLKRYRGFIRMEMRVTSLEVLQKRQQSMLRQVRLEAAFAEICKAVDLADSHDLEDLEWLAYWAAILREAKEQGCDFLGTTNTCKTASMEGKEAPAVECDQEEDELSTLVHRLEGLAMDVEYFSKLVYLCPAR